MMARVANKIYDSCRTNQLSLSGFPDFTPIVQSLKNQSGVDREKAFRVSCQQHDKLVILELFAKKWVDTDITKERALEVIRLHNEEYNVDGQYWQESERREKCEKLN